MLSGLLVGSSVCNCSVATTETSLPNKRMQTVELNIWAPVLELLCLLVVSQDAGGQYNSSKGQEELVQAMWAWEKISPRNCHHAFNLKGLPCCIHPHFEGNYKQIPLAQSKCSMMIRILHFICVPGIFSQNLLIWIQKGKHKDYFMQYYF